GSEPVSDSTSRKTVDASSMGLDGCSPALSEAKPGACLRAWQSLPLSLPPGFRFAQRRATDSTDSADLFEPRLDRLGVGQAVEDPRRSRIQAVVRDEGLDSFARCFVVLTDRQL